MQHFARLINNPDRQDFSKHFYNDYFNINLRKDPIMLYFLYKKRYEFAYPQIWGNFEKCGNTVWKISLSNDRLWTL